MTRMLYITDTHWGAVPGQGWGQQPRDPVKFAVLVEGLRGWLTRNPIDLILHGGDATEHATRPQILDAAQTLASLGPPTYLCLGNHDLERPDAIDDWRALASRALPDGRETFVVRRPEFDLYVLAHHWNAFEPPHFWNQAGQIPLISDGQRVALESHLRAADRPVVLALHAPVAAIPPEQTSQPQPMHTPDPAYRNLIVGLLDRYPALRLVLTAHNHTNTIERRAGRAILSTAAFNETPFEARLITIDRTHIDVQTLRFGDLLGLTGEYDAAKAWVNGGPAERSCRVTCA